MSLLLILDVMGFEPNLDVFMGLSLDKRVPETLKHNCCDMGWHFGVATQFLGVVTGLDMAGRLRVATWNRCWDRANPLGVATQLLVSRPAKRAVRVTTGRALLVLGDRALGACDSTCLCAQCTRPACCSALCCALFGSLSGTLFMGTIKKKKSKFFFCV